MHASAGKILWLDGHYVAALIGGCFPLAFDAAAVSTVMLCLRLRDLLVDAARTHQPHVPR